MLYCEKCHYVVLEEDEFREVVEWLEGLSLPFPELSDEDGLLEYLYNCRDILRAWDASGGDD